jgi:magnesium transporter
MAISLFLTILMAVLIGVCVPFILQKLKKDPAIGTGPFATILRDIMSLIIYFSVSIFLLKLVQIL